MTAVHKVSEPIGIGEKWQQYFDAIIDVHLLEVN